MSDWGPVPLCGADIISAQVFSLPTPHGIDLPPLFCQRRDVFMRKMDDTAKGLMPWEDPVL